MERDGGFEDGAWVRYDGHDQLIAEITFEGFSYSTMINPANFDWPDPSDPDDINDYKISCNCSSLEDAKQWCDDELARLDYRTISDSLKIMK